ncbi:MAG TPA: response regulator, partial [Candidatus Blautia faecavium]|nr:response regulator [Candidatus Blautia faecavium]
MRKVVIVDDEYIVVKGIQAMIAREKMDFQVVGHALNGIDGLSLILEQKPDLVISDIRMPGMDGLSLIEAAREECPDTVFVVISGYQEFEYARKALSLGVKGYIDKPITISKVRDTLEMAE